MFQTIETGISRYLAYQTSQAKQLIKSSLGLLLQVALLDREHGMQHVANSSCHRLSAGEIKKSSNQTHAC